MELIGRTDFTDVTTLSIRVSEEEARAYVLSETPAPGVYIVVADSMGQEVLVHPDGHHENFGSITSFSRRFLRDLVMFIGANV